MFCKTALRELPSSPPSDSTDSNYNEHLKAIGRTIDLVSPIESWQDNWLFQKKKTNRSQPDAIAMLVPSSNTYYKALIGDRDVEDTSDLSECSSTKSDEEIDKELMEAINNVVPRIHKFSEYNAKDNQGVTNDATQFGKVDEIDKACQAKTNIKKNTIIYDHFDKEDNKKLQISEKKTVKNKNDKREQNKNKSSSALIMREESKTKQKSKDIVEYDERIITAIGNFAQENIKMHPEKSSNQKNAVDKNEDQRESEYTEHYDTVIQRHLDSLTINICCGESETDNETKKLTEEEFRKSEKNSTEKQKRYNSRNIFL